MLQSLAIFSIAWLWNFGSAWCTNKNWKSSRISSYFFPFHIINQLQRGAADKLFLCRTYLVNFDILVHVFSYLSYLLQIFLLAVIKTRKQLRKHCHKCSGSSVCTKIEVSNTWISLPKKVKFTCQINLVWPDFPSQTLRILWLLVLLLFSLKF